MIKLSLRSVALTAALALAYASTPVAAASLDRATTTTTIAATIGSATLARHGADDPAGVDRGGRGRGRGGADDGRGRGADDGRGRGADDGRGHTRNGADNAPGDANGGRGRGADDGRGHA